MKKFLFIMVVTAMIAAGAVSTTLTKETLYLYEKNPCTGDIVEDGAWGCLQYRPAYKNFAFWFGAMYLEPCTDYTLVYYPNRWPARGLICLGEGTTDAKGRIHICGTPNVGDLPKKYDRNCGARIRLVLSSDVCCCSRMMIGWHPTEYLFEDHMITFDDWDD
jgi:hypothetical protein